MKKKIYFVATVLDPIHIFLRPYLVDLSIDYDITIICNLENKFFNKFNNFKYLNIKISRSPNLLNDIYVFTNLLILFLFNRPHKIISITPKSGLFCTLLSRLLFIDNLHFITGQFWENERSKLKIKIYKSIDKFIGQFSSKIIVDSRPQYQTLIKQGLINKKAFFFNSVSGIDFSKFYRNSRFKLIFKSKKKLSLNSFGLIYVGRINKDKGIENLLLIYNKLRIKLKKNIFLIIVGEDEIGYLSKQYSKLKKNNIFYFGKQNNINYYLNLCDLFITCTKREGFCQSIIEANAVGLPAVSNYLYNLSDTITNNKTGFLTKDNVSFYKSILKLYNNKILYNKFRFNAIQRVRFEFNQKSYVYKFRTILFND